MHKFFFYNKFIIFLHMFRALLGSPSGGQNCIIQHLVSSQSVGGRPVHRTATYKVWWYLLLLLLLLWGYNSDTVLALSTISFHLRRSCTCSVHFTSYIFFRPFLTSSSHRDLGLPAGLPANGFHLSILFTMLVSGILFVCPNQLNRWALT